MITLRDYTPGDLSEILTLFYETVHTVNARDYCAEALAAWAPCVSDKEAWQKRLTKAKTLVATAESGTILGFASLDVKCGLLDHLFVHKNHQRQGIATMMCNALEPFAQTERLWTEASLTAVPFFLARGWQVCKRQRVWRRGEALENVIMEKENIQ